MQAPMTWSDEAADGQRETDLGRWRSTYDLMAEHVEADAVHEQVMRHDVVGDLVGREPELAADIVFGMRALDYLDDLAAEKMLAAWKRGESSLLP